MTDKYEIAARAHLAGLDGRWLRLPAAQQRAIFGANLFGKKKILIDTDNQGVVHYAFSVCFGTDWATGEYSFEEIARQVNEGRPLTF
jgi:hypothetical protein